MAGGPPGMVDGRYRRRVPVISPLALAGHADLSRSGSAPPAPSADGLQHGMTVATDRPRTARCRRRWRRRTSRWLPSPPRRWPAKSGDRRIDLRIEAGRQDVVRIRHRRIAGVLAGEHVDAAILGIQQARHLPQRVARRGRDAVHRAGVHALDVVELRIEVGRDRLDLRQRRLRHRHAAGRGIHVVLPGLQIGDLRPQIERHRRTGAQTRRSCRRSGRCSPDW